LGLVLALIWGGRGEGPIPVVLALALVRASGHYWAAVASPEGSRAVWRQVVWRQVGYWVIPASGRRE
jgi:hypothetical protein